MLMCRRPLGIAFLAAGLLALSCVSGDREGEVPTDLSVSDGSPPNTGQNLVSWDVLTDVPKGKADGEMLEWNDAAKAWEVTPAPAGTGTVTSVGTGPGLSGGPIVGTGTIDLDISPTGGLTTALAGNQLGDALAEMSAAF